MENKADHPGKVLASELVRLGVSPTELARQLQVPPNRISQIIHGKRAITGDTALRLAHWFHMPPEYWLGLQAAFDVYEASKIAGSTIRRLPTGPRAQPQHSSSRD